MRGFLTARGKWRAVPRPAFNAGAASPHRFACDPAGEHGGGLEEVVDLHGLVRIVAAVGVAHEQHGRGNAGRRERRRIVRGRACERHGACADGLGRRLERREHRGVRWRHVRARPRS